jgi:hypothetical protein
LSTLPTEQNAAPGIVEFYYPFFPSQDERNLTPRPSLPLLSQDVDDRRRTPRAARREGEAKERLLVLLCGGGGGGSGCARSETFLPSFFHPWPHATE